MSFIVNSLSSFLGGVLIFAAFIGLGYLTREILHAREKASVAEAAATGMAVASLLGGLLNLFHGITLFTIVLMEVTGIAGFVLFRKTLGHRFHSLSQVSAAFILTVVTIWYVRSVSNV